MLAALLRITSSAIGESARFDALQQISPLLVESRIVGVGVHFELGLCLKVLCAQALSCREDLPAHHGGCDAEIQEVHFAVELNCRFLCDVEPLFSGDRVASQDGYIQIVGQAVPRACEPNW